VARYSAYRPDLHPVEICIAQEVIEAGDDRGRRAGRHEHAEPRLDDQLPSRWSIGEGHVGIEVLEHIDDGLPGVGEDGMPGSAAHPDFGLAPNNGRLMLPPQMRGNGATPFR
jgi:hypothetical protein